MSKEKAQKSLLLLPLAIALCCFVPVLLLFVATGAAVSFIKENKVGIVAFGVLALTLAVYVINKNRRKKDDCC